MLLCCMVFICLISCLLWITCRIEVRPRSFSSQNLDIVDIDKESNPQLVSSYVKDIYNYLLELEVLFLNILLLIWVFNKCCFLMKSKTPINANYMEGYRIRPSMRAVLIDWLVEVHGRFKLLQETLYLTVAMMDLYLQVLHFCLFIYLWNDIN